ncbi:MAG: cobyric acid synthase [Thermoplasmatales archaeon]|nr:cobyric acid synthase [Thermoplasmatales archaeon]MCW6171113.1 cobyric acid synthase [Thermoplasmatales archaeon]
MKGRKIIQVIGTSSDSGKSTITMALCRALSDLGIRVYPFKSVNMSLNSISVQGEFEISRSQWLQAIASRVKPIPEINPILIKPEGGMKSQIISMGKSLGKLSYAEYGKFLREQGKSIIRQSLDKLLELSDVVIAEGAGSAAEINLYERDLANDFVSSIYNTPMILVSDIERGGAFSSIYGVVKLMQRPELLRWIVINKMRGDKSLLKDGIRKIEDLTGKKLIAVIPYMDFTLPGEDSLDYAKTKLHGTKVCVVKYPHMENYSDVDPFYISGVGINIIDQRNVNDLKVCDAIILPGSKNVEADLRFMRETGIDQQIIDAGSEGKKILGICGGYQMLGNEIIDKGGVELKNASIRGLGLLNCKTIYVEKKSVRNVSYRPQNEFFKSEKKMNGYEIHYGQVATKETPAFLIEGQGEGSISINGNIIGTNIHGALEHPVVLSYILGMKQNFDFMGLVEENIKMFTKHFMQNADLTEILEYIHED